MISAPESWRSAILGAELDNYYFLKFCKKYITVVLNGLKLNALKFADLYTLELLEKKDYFQKPIQS